MSDISEQKKYRDEKDIKMDIITYLYESKMNKTQYTGINDIMKSVNINTQKAQKVLSELQNDGAVYAKRKGKARNQTKRDYMSYTLTEKANEMIVLMKSMESQINKVDVIGMVKPYINKIPKNDKA